MDEAEEERKKEKERIRERHSVRNKTPGVEREKKKVEKK